jgi:ABC-2 type transport system permease protein
MSNVVYAAHDSATMLRRDLRHALRYPLVSLSGVGMPVLFLLLFGGVYGRALRAGLGAAAPGAGAGGYVAYLIPGILLMTACSVAETTAVNVSTDMTEGIIARFRTMAITRASVLTGPVIGGMVRAMISGVFVVTVALGLGFRPSASIPGWIAAVAVFAMFSVAVTWLTTALGLLAKTPAGANSLALLIVVLPFFSSAFVPTASMPAGVAWFARNQPFTPVIQTLRGLLTDTSTGSEAALAIAWCAGISLLGYLWARSLYNRNRAQ